MLYKEILHLHAIRCALVFGPGQSRVRIIWRGPRPVNTDLVRQTFPIKDLLLHPVNGCFGVGRQAPGAAENTPGTKVVAMATGRLLEGPANIVRNSVAIVDGVEVWELSVIGREDLALSASSLGGRLAEAVNMKEVVMARSKKMDDTEA